MRLRNSDPSSAGIRRRRRGRGFSYEAPDGSSAVSDDDRARIDALVIPPAWRKVWICPHANGHIQAVGVDAAGRRQYLYHERWRQERDAEKYDRVLSLAARLPEWREHVGEALRRRGRGRYRVEAVALRMLDRGVLRIGGEEYAEEHGSRGVATLLREHVTVRADEVQLDFPAKSGVQRTLAFEDAALATALRSLLRADAPPSDRLLVYRRGGKCFEVHADDVNARFKDVAGDEYTVKDLRTWHATVIAAVAFADIGAASSKRARSSAETEVMREVASVLGNTPQVARTSYVDPRVITAFDSGHTIASSLRRARRASSEDAEREVVERAVIRLLGR
ncbi:DNA topoisomerase IB [Rhodococcus sp. NCIMB 12038]|uniref:DNA topoisomerase IB n=1 Tax=Rhodococcus sp. NCIMB 12038 TaxID=933800 RepID=UPI000B3C66F9|nr:DNA topoisomerase IB [Rhodococcus sp. NCIMB 12038]OUS95159.1 DNA topoisomerase [Rhodococcus sp. NCIMB 12038]